LGRSFTGFASFLRFLFKLPALDTSLSLGLNVIKMASSRSQSSRVESRRADFFSISSPSLRSFIRFNANSISSAERRRAVESVRRLNALRGGVVGCAARPDRLCVAEVSPP
jgi:hypothetical protein